MVDLGQNGHRSGPEKGVITQGVFSLEKSLESLNSLESLENGRILLCFPESGGSLESLNSLESLENGLFCKDPFSQKTPFPKDPDTICHGNITQLIRNISNRGMVIKKNRRGQGS